MKTFGVILSTLSLILIAKESVAEKCPTCRGAGCSSNNVFELECTKFVPALPFENQLIMDHEVRENSEYGCLNLEYHFGESIEHIQQCILVDDLDSFCNILENTMNIKSCIITANGNKRIVKSPVVEGNEPEESMEKGHDTTSEPAGPTAPPKPDTDSGIKHLLSSASFLAVCIVFLM